MSHPINQNASAVILERSILNLPFLLAIQTSGMLKTPGKVGIMPDNAEKVVKLISMGLARFGQLSETELKLFRAAANGDVAEFRVGNGALNHPAYAN